MGISSCDDIEKLRKENALTAAELTLLNNARSGEPTVFGGDKRPQDFCEECSIRADLLRFLILGGGETCKVHERGVVLEGGWITGELDARFIEASGTTALTKCVFEKQIEAKGASFRLLDLSKSKFPGLQASGAEINGDLNLANCHSKGSVQLEGSSIGGQLILKNARVEAEDTPSVYAQGLHVGTDVILREFFAKGEVNLVGAVIGGQLSCTKACLDNEDGKALNGFRMRVNESLYWRDLETVRGKVDLSFAQLSELIDDEESWAKVESLVLVGLTYQHLLDPHDFDMRRAWLKKGSLLARGKFFPQPYLQLAKALRETGHRTDAREILIEKEKEQRLARMDSLAASRELRAVLQDYLKTPATFRWRKLQKTKPAAVGIYKQLSRRFQAKFEQGDFDVLINDPPPEFKGLIWFRLQLSFENVLSSLNSAISFCGDKLYRYVSAYGYKPGRSVIHILVLCAVLTAFVHMTWTRGGLVPNSRSIVTTKEWRDAVAAGKPNPSEVWLKNAGVDYTDFNSMLYAADVFIPIIRFGQVEAWAPSPGRSVWGMWLFRLQALFKVLGWAYSAILVAALSGKIRRAD